MMHCVSQSSLDKSSQRPALPDATPPGPAHAAKLLGELARLREHAALTDVRLVAQAPVEDVVGASTAEAVAASGAAGGADSGVSAHRVVLAAASPYFHAMFTQFDERTQPVVTIQNVEPAALETIVEYIYNPDYLIITEDNVQSLLSAASLLQVLGVRAACCGFLAAALAPDNALGIRAFAELHACADLAATAQRFIDAHAQEVMDSEEFLTLTPDVLAAMLDSDRITVPNEEVILDAVIRWMQHDPEERRLHLGALLEHVRLPLLPQDTLVARAAAEPLASAPLKVKDLVIEALSFHLMRPERRLAAAAACARARPRQSPRALPALLLVGGRAPNYNLTSKVEVFSLDAGCGAAGSAGTWRAACELPTRRSHVGLAVVHGKVYAVGGRCSDGAPVRSVDVYDILADAWAAGPPLRTCRSTHGVAAIGDTIYAVGGFDGETRLSSAEALDIRTGMWRPIASMSSKRFCVGVGVLQGKLYAVGGYKSTSLPYLRTVERYDPATDTWEPVAEMTARRWCAGVGVVGDALYAVGGHDERVHRSVERFRPGHGWAPAPPMRTARKNAAVVAHAGRLYVVGGHDGPRNLDTVEVFEPATESWSLLEARMSVGRSYAGVCVVERPA